MWYNKVVTDNNNNILFKERIFIEDYNGKLMASYGHINGYWVEEWWEK